MPFLLSFHRFAATLLAALIAAPVIAADDFSPAERALFMTRHFDGMKPPVTLHYAYSQSGPLSEPFSDKVEIRLQAKSDGACCGASTTFLSGVRKLSLPEVEAAEGNPAVLYFLEREVREMSRVTKGQSSYFRKRIRMAIYQGAKIEDIPAVYKGKPITAQQIAIEPYLDDPLRARFEKYAPKRYVFTMSSAVPGGLVAMRSSVAGEDPAGAPLLLDEMILDGAAIAAPRKP